MTPQEYCQDKAGGTGSTFYYSSIFLESAARAAMTALYAFREEVRAITRGQGDIHMVGMKLAWWRKEIVNTFADRPSHPVSKLLYSAVHAYGLPQQPLLDVIAGVEHDLTHVRYATFDELRLHCQQLTSATVLLSTHILGGNTSSTEPLLRDLGVALHLTEILRDVGEDARRNRIYLPMEDLVRFHVNAHDILQARETENFYALMEYEAQRVYSLFETVLQSLPEPDRWQQLFHVIMTRIYLVLLREMRTEGFHVLQYKIALTPLRKAWTAWRTWRREKRVYNKFRRAR